jgi:hypothetical protein
VSISHASTWEDGPNGERIFVERQRLIAATRRTLAGKELLKIDRATEGSSIRLHEKTFSPGVCNGKLRKGVDRTYCRISIFYKRGPRGAQCRTFGCGVEVSEAIAIGRALISWAEAQGVTTAPVIGDPDDDADVSYSACENDARADTRTDDELSPAELAEAVDAPRPGWRARETAGTEPPVLAPVAVPPPPPKPTPAVLPAVVKLTSSDPSLLDLAANYLQGKGYFATREPGALHVRCGARHEAEAIAGQFGFSDRIRAEVAQTTSP